MEYATEGDLLAKINEHIRGKTEFTEDELWGYASEIASGLKSLHDLKVLHRDLKVIFLFIARALTYT